MEKIKGISWKAVTQEQQLDEIINRSFEKPVAIFKHSIRCGLSAMVKSQLESEWDLSEEELEVYYLDLISYRPISNKVAEVTGVPHQSPQIILLRNGEVQYHTSHSAITVKGVRKVLAA
ncbi:MAG: bacillithiol system redox-active protein YtxJ [Bacteroidota bacterium]